MRVAGNFSGTEVFLGPGFWEKENDPTHAGPPAGELGDGHGPFGPEPCQKGRSPQPPGATRKQYSHRISNGKGVPIISNS